jgi:hypothetical protein
MLDHCATPDIPYQNYRYFLERLKMSLKFARAFLSCCDRKPITVQIARRVVYISVFRGLYVHRRAERDRQTGCREELLPYQSDLVRGNQS